MKFALRHFCSRCTSVGRGRKLIMDLALVWAQGTRKECHLDACEDAVLRAANTGPYRVWQQGEQCASRRCKLDMEECT